LSPNCLNTNRRGGGVRVNLIGHTNEKKIGNVGENKKYERGKRNI
jgi:hypothetical protein